MGLFRPKNRKVEANKNNSKKIIHCKKVSPKTEEIKALKALRGKIQQKRNRAFQKSITD